MLSYCRKNCACSLCSIEMYAIGHRYQTVTRRIPLKFYSNQYLVKHAISAIQEINYFLNYLVAAV